jgi:assimilatory nitrate reductase catalytic subunit
VQQGRGAAPDGKAGLSPAASELRLDRSQPRQRVGWDAALDHAADRFAEIIRAHGPDSVAFYVSGQLLTEDYYVFNKLAKGLIGTNNIDTNSRLCMSSAVAGYKQTLGADAPPCCYEDIALTDCLLIAGANPAVAHPIVFRRIEDARAANPELRIIVIDPRRSETAALADLHLALRPGTDIALYNGLLNVLLGEQLVDRDYIAKHTEGFDELEARIVAAYPPAAVAEICGLAETDIIQAARWFGTAGAALSLYCQGLNQSSHGTHNNAALIHLHLATGQIGRPGAGPFSLTGQPNAMGGREVGGLANLLSAHRDLANPKHRDEVARLWGVPSVPQRPAGPPSNSLRGSSAECSRPSGSPAPILRNRCLTRPKYAPRCRPPSSSCCRKPTPIPTRPPMRTCCCRRPPGAKRKERSPTPSVASPT